MKLIWIGAMLLLFSSVVRLISNPQSGRLIDNSWASARIVLPDTKRNELQRRTPGYAAQILGRLPEPFRQKFAAKTWQALELIIFRTLMLRHAAPALLITLGVGFLEGLWARTSQKSLVRMHSPIGFSLALASLGFMPILAALWITAPMFVPATLLVSTLGALGSISARNLVVHAPTQF